MADRDVDELVELITETLCAARPTIRVGGENMPAEQVKARFLGFGGNIPHAGLLCGQLDLIRVLLRLLGDGSVSLLGRIAEFSAKGIASEQADRGEAPAELSEAPADPAPADAPTPEQADQGEAPASTS